MIDLLCPTYGRPERMATMYKSAKDTAELPKDVVVWAAIEEDDAQRYNYKVGLHFDCIVIGKWGYAAPAWNTLVKHSNGAIIHQTADDLIFRTRGWDLKVRDHFCEQPFKVLHYKDDLRDERMALNAFVSREFVKRIGYIDPELWHFFSDTHLEEIGRLAGTLVYDPTIHITQAHFKNSLAPFDATYAKTRNNEIHAHDLAVWNKNANWRKDLAARLTAS